MGIENVSSSQVSHAAKALDEELDRWRERPLGEARYLQLDARYKKMRHEGVMRDIVVLTAVGIEPDGRRGVLGFPSRCRRPRPLQRQRPRQEQPNNHEFG